MAELNSSEVTIQVLPENWDGAGGIARCLMFYDWERELGEKWLDLVDAIFAEFGVEPREGTGNLGKAHSHGSYKRVRNRLREFLQAEKGARRDFRIQGEPYVMAEGFFPSDIGVVWGHSISMQEGWTKSGLIAVRGNRAESCHALVERIGARLFQKLGGVYGAAFDFPTLYGPDAYLSSVGAIPKGGSGLANRKYTARMTRWRDNTWQLGLRAGQGYLREVYPINFVLEAHLKMPFQGRPLSELMEKVGDLRPSGYDDRMYRWDVPEESLETVRQALEPSGLILSSPTPPLRL
jgi:hypothetical protein